MDNWITKRNRYIRAKAYRNACTNPGFIKVKIHDSWMSQDVKHAVYREETVKHPDFYKVMNSEIARIRRKLVKI